MKLNVQEDSFNTPVLLIVFNRPNKTKLLFDQIRLIKPKYLYLAADGPRNDYSEDSDKCQEVKRIFKAIDWNCNVKSLYRSENLGCGRGPSEAISWFFAQVEEGIILEDDCLPNTEFFYYCQELLEYYRYSNKIFFIAGANFQDGTKHGNASYYFSAGNQGTWGWATWRRSWLNYEYQIESIELEQIRKKINKLFANKFQQEYWEEIFKNVKVNRYNDTCWDYQFYFKVWMQNALAVIPNVNLVSNIGFDEEGTHTKNANDPFAKKQLENILPILHPSLIIQNRKADFYLHKTYLQPDIFKNSVFARLLLRLKVEILNIIKTKFEWK